MTTTPGASAEAALALLQPFTTRHLAGTLRRIASWKGVPLKFLRGLEEDLRQELVLDAIEAPQRICSLDETERHLHWMRVVERWIYRFHGAAWRRRAAAADLEDLPAPGAGVETLPSELPLGLGVSLRNGRLNVSRSARARAVSVAAMRRSIDAVAVRLGRDDAYRTFWRNRLGEALTGLAADLLRLRGGLHLVPRARHLPDTGARIARLRRLRPRFRAWRRAIELRRATARWLAAREFDDHAPRRLLTDAAALCPHASATWLWLFEACTAEGDLLAAAHALRGARSTGTASPTALVLARARLAEARGRWRAVVAVLARGCRRWPRDAVLQRTLHGLADGSVPTDHGPTGHGPTGHGPTGHGATSASRSAVASSRSATASPRTSLQSGTPSNGSRNQRTSTTTASPPPSANTEARRSHPTSASSAQAVCRRSGSASATCTAP